jgi:hypothetical protein
MDTFLPGNPPDGFGLLERKKRCREQERRPVRPKKILKKSTAGDRLRLGPLAASGG